MRTERIILHANNSTNAKNKINRSIDVRTISVSLEISANYKTQVFIEI